MSDVRDKQQPAHWSRQIEEDLSAILHLEGANLARPAVAVAGRNRAGAGIWKGALAAALPVALASWFLLARPAPPPSPRLAPATEPARADRARTPAVPHAEKAAAPALAASLSAPPAATGPVRLALAPAGRQAGGVPVTAIASARAPALPGRKADSASGGSATLPGDVAFVWTAPDAEPAAPPPAATDAQALATRALADEKPAAPALAMNTPLPPPAQIAAEPLPDRAVARPGRVSDRRELSAKEQRKLASIDAIRLLRRQ